VTADPVADVRIPGHAFTFGVVEAAQARGDLQVLAERNRRVLRVDLRSDVEAGLALLGTAFEEALR
jgi:transaldolase/glucose-6-phosphate isomerase